MTQKLYALITGTRPQIIKSVPVLRCAKKEKAIKIIHIFTGQHYDNNLADIFFQTLALNPPEHQLNVHSGLTDYHIRKIIEKIIPILTEEALNGIIVPGDTNSALAGALAGNFLFIPVIHLEAGLRSYDLKMQEELNRRLIDHGSSVLFAPTRTAVNNLRSESVLGKVILSGDTMYDLLASEMDKIRDKTRFKETTKNIEIYEKDYLVLTIHRRENLNDLNRLKRILKSIGQSKIVSVFPIHPHTKKIINMSEINIPDNVKMIDPLSYHDFLNLIAFSGLVITDSGGLQKEAYLLDVPCVTLRDSTEWVETIEHDTNMIVGSNSELILKAIAAMYAKELKTDKNVYGDGRASETIIREITENNPEIPSIPIL